MIFLFNQIFIDDSISFLVGKFYPQGTDDEVAGVGVCQRLYADDNVRLTLYLYAI